MIWDLLVGAVAVIAFGSCIFLLYKTGKNNKFLLKLAGRYSYVYHEHTRKPEELNRLISEVCSLSGGEVELILQKIFGRQIRVVKSVDESGQIQLEAVSILQDESEPITKRLNELMTESFKGKNSPIG